MCALLETRLLVMRTPWTIISTDSYPPGGAAEDCERSIRFFAKDHVILKYMMYAADSTPYVHRGGLQTRFKDCLARKKAENDHIEKLQKAFPGFLRFEAKDSLQTVNITFSTSTGLNPLKPDGCGGWADLMVH